MGTDPNTGSYTQDPYDIEDWQAYRQDLLSHGYAAGYPPRERDRAEMDFEAVDREIARDAVCPVCGNHNEYAPFHDAVRPGQRGSYVAIAYCATCNKALSF